MEPHWNWCTLKKTKHSFLLCNSGSTQEIHGEVREIERVVLRIEGASFCRQDGEEDMQKRKGGGEVHAYV